MESALYKKYIGSPCKQSKIDPKKEAYQDSVKTLHKGAYKNYLKQQKEGYNISDDDGQTVNFIPPQKDKTKIKSLKEFAYDMEIAKGGSVTKDGKTAAQLARENK
jgi:hypothetical protein